MSRKSMFCKEYFWQILVTIGGLFMIFVTLLIGAFLVYKGSDTFLKFHHTLQEFLGSANFAPMDNASSKGHVGALIFIVGSLCVCGLALLIATPFALGSSIFMTEISPKFGEKFYRPMVEIFAGIPSVVYGWVGLTVLIPFLKKVFDLQVGHSILAASLVLSIMIFPSITSVASDAIRAVSKETRMAAYGLGSTRWQAIFHVLLPACLPRIMTGIILAAGRGFGEAAVLLYTTGSGTNIRWSNWDIASSTCPLNPFRSAETLSLQIWDLQVNGQNQALANLASAVLLILVLAFSIGANVLSNRINKKNSGEKA